MSCYNEERSIIPTLTTLVSALEQCPLTAEIIAMDDASQDNSIDTVQRFIAGFGHPNVLVRHHLNKANRGLTWNVFEAMKIGKGKYFWSVAGDNPLSKEAYLTMFSAVGRADIIIPNVLRYCGRPVYRQLISRLYVWLVNALSGYSVKYYNGSSIYVRSMVVEYANKIRGFGYSAELIVSLLDQGKSYVEVDVVFNDRTTGKSRALTFKNFCDVAGFFGRLARRRWQRRRGVLQPDDRGKERSERKVGAAGP